MCRSKPRLTSADEFKDKKELSITKKDTHTHTHTHRERERRALLLLLLPTSDDEEHADDKTFFGSDVVTWCRLLQRVVVSLSLSSSRALRSIMASSAHFLSIREREGNVSYASVCFYVSSSSARSKNVVGMTRVPSRAATFGFPAAIHFLFVSFSFSSLVSCPRHSFSDFPASRHAHATDTVRPFTHS